ncbi:hypothetical protein chiPu_0012524 [Chiloscyllium punctatum]|uniref:Transcription factor A, mitochondrial n=1 Tax=Chiloscyllium punctatum TaxID=137246 RepID=A0A401SUH9_CHIPU|nr:hypothetical protein [Chiloscyllium punctatum]
MAGVVALGAALLGRRLGGAFSCRPWPARACLNDFPPKVITVSPVMRMSANFCLKRYLAFFNDLEESGSKLTILGKPKRPRTAFNIFMAENFEEAKGATSQAKLKNLQDEWHRQSDQQKQMYTQLAEDDKVRYQNEIKLWEEQMIETGHGDVIRVKQKRSVQKLLRKKVKAHQMADKTTKPSATSSATKAVKSKTTSEE